MGSRSKVVRAETAAVAPPPQRPPSERTKSNQTHARRDPKCSRDRRNQVDGSLRQRSEAAHLEGQTDMPRIY
jgi:hypothetical protein